MGSTKSAPSPLAAKRFPTLYEINTRVWLRRLTASLGRPASLDDVPEAELDAIAAAGFDWVWLLSVWRTGPAGRHVALTHPEWRAGYAHVLADLTDDDVVSSGFAIVDYEVSDAIGGDAALARFRKRLADRGIRLMLDFVPNHMALDAVWLDQYPDYFLAGTEADIERAPENYTRVETSRGSRILAHGRDPNYAAWPDTLQLDYENAALQQAQVDNLLRIAERCDGVRCDMAMLLLPDVFERTWGKRPQPFWPSAIERVRSANPGFTFLAEVYWDLEWTLQQEGFDFCYDKRLYDRLREYDARAIRDHIRYASLDYQQRLARFLENHDEERAAAVFPPPIHQAAAMITFFSPGLRLFYEGQLEGRRIHISTQLLRAPEEPVDAEIQGFYARLLSVLRQQEFHEGEWTFCDPLPAWPGNWSCNGFVAFTWQSREGSRFLVVVNYQEAQGQCHVRLPFAEIHGKKCRIVDRMGTAEYERDGSAMCDPGLYIDLGPWGYNLFEVIIIQG